MTAQRQLRVGVQVVGLRTMLEHIFKAGGIIAILISLALVVVRIHVKLSKRLNWC
jgi:hypothetical protein